MIWLDENENANMHFFKCSFFVAYIANTAYQEKIPTQLYPLEL